MRQNEQILHISLRVVQAAPLMIGCDLSDLDPFMLDLLTNQAVMEVFNDPLGKSYGRGWKDQRLEVWARPASDGSFAVGLFNRGLQPYDLAARWSDLGLSGTQRVRDLWQQKDLGAFNDSYTARVPRHGAILVKIGELQK